MFEITYFDGRDLVVTKVPANNVVQAAEKSGAQIHTILKVERVAEKR